jgi:small subunit ribosomal protein S17e
LGKVKTEHVKRVARALMARFPDKFSSNFDENKRLVSELTQGATTRVRNQVAGYITSVCTIAQAEASSESPEETTQT